jgi:hypothetical protein
VSLLTRAAKFVARELASGVVSEFGKELGRHIGDALGTVAGRKIDPEHAREPKDDKSDDAPGAH